MIYLVGGLLAGLFWDVWRQSFSVNRSDGRLTISEKSGAPLVLFGIVRIDMDESGVFFELVRRGSEVKK